jgi:hypothetical protein
MSILPVRVGGVAALIAAAALVSVTSVPVFAQDAAHDWQKIYPVGGSASLSVETGDSRLEIRSCRDCREIRVKVHTGRKLSEFQLEEHQDQNHVFFLLKDKPRVGIHVTWKSTEPTIVTVETPAKLELDARTSGGNMSARGLEGNLQVHSGDGGVTVDDVRGSLKLNSSNGDITIHNAVGTLEARASDGHMRIDGQFSAVQLHTSDGTLDFALAQGSQLSAASRIESSDGRVTIRVPQDLKADLDVSTSDGHVDCALPLTMDHYDNGSSSGHHLRGHLNAGGTALSIHTTDGNVSIATL